MLDKQKTEFIKRLLYAVNALTALYVIFIILFSASIFTKNYKDLAKKHSNIENVYNETVKQYKNVAIFILKNNLPKNITYFNSQAKLAYNLFPTENFSIVDNKESVLNKKTKSISDLIIGCHNDKCIKVITNRKGILNKISKSKSWGYGEITEIPIKKTTLLERSISAFFKDHQYFFIISFLYLLILYSSQSLFLFIKYFKLAKVYNSLATSSNKNKQKLIKQSKVCNKLYNNILFIKELTDEYFTRYIPELIDRDTFIEKIDLTDVFEDIEQFFSHQITKRSLNIILDLDDNIRVIESDNEILFVVLLNFMFRAIYRSKTSSNIGVKAFSKENKVEIEIKDVGYNYSPEPNDKIKMYELSDPILEKLCRKIKIDTIEENKNGELNTISIQIVKINIKQLSEQQIINGDTIYN